MKRNLLFIAAALITFGMTAQSINFKTKYDSDISGGSYAEHGDGTYLSETKFHLENTSSNSITYGVNVYEISNAPNSDLQVCFGTSCYTGTAGVSGAQLIAGTNTTAGNTTYNDFKVAPFAYGWTSGQTATWRITVFDTTNTSDSVSTIISWTMWPTGLEAKVVEEVSINAYPNPATNNVTFKFNNVASSTNIVIYDVLGKKVESIAIMNTKGNVNVDVSNLNKGVYFYSIISKDKALVTKKLVIK